MAAEASRSVPSTDSYIGSLISLTSRCEIRYEGILYNLNTEGSSIGLRNVRSFGTEGRKKDGLQIPPSDKIYEFILFRGNDIKDLQVKSSSLVQTAPLHNDPAIIQSQYSPTVPALTPAGSGIIPDMSSHIAQIGHPRTTFQGGLPLFQPGENIGSWGSTPPPSANGSGHAIPMYWQGFYAPTSELSQLHQPSLLRAPPGLSIPHSLQQHVQFSNINSFFPSGTPSLPEVASPLMPLASITPSSVSSSVEQPVQYPNINSFFASATPTLPEFSSSSVPNLIATSLPATVFTTQGSILDAESSLNLLPNKPLLNSHPASVLGLNLPLLPPLGSRNGSEPSVPKHTASLLSNPCIMPASSLPFQTISQFMPPVIDLSSSKQGETSVPLVTPGQLLQPSYSMLPSSLYAQKIHKGAENKALEPKTKPPSEGLTCEPTTAARSVEPILPLPKSVHRRLGIFQSSRAATYDYHHRGRGRGRGRGNAFSEPVTSFTEEFDFAAMNEKFNKDEVWGHLGKGKGLVKCDEIEQHENGIGKEESIKVEIKPIYCKDDFFDKLSCNTLSRGTLGGRARFSEQLKVDTETFGNFLGHQSNRGRGRGFRGGNVGHAQGFYYGRGNGFNSRGRGHVASSRIR